MKSIIVVLLVGVIFFSVIFAISDRFMPDSGFYNFKRIYEKGKMATIRDPEKKTEYSLELLERRHKEIEYLAKNHKYEIILSASLRYSTTAGQTVQLIKDYHLAQFTPEIKQKFAAHKKTFQYYESRVGIVGGQKDFLRDASNYIDLYSKELANVK